jgi:hypothetical protein
MSVVAEQEQADELPERWSAKAKTDVVLRLLRGESVEAVSREVQVPAHELEAWRRTFLEAGGEPAAGICDALLCRGGVGPNRRCALAVPS